MADIKDKNINDKSREHLANERTFLAWVRTSIALMGFGFVIMKFSLFLKEMSLLINTDVDKSEGFSSTVGIVMVALGIIITVLSYFQYRKSGKQLNTNSFDSSSRLTLLLTLIMLLGGIGLIAYLLSGV